MSQFSFCDGKQAGIASRYNPVMATCFTYAVRTDDCDQQLAELDELFSTHLAPAGFQKHGPYIRPFLKDGQPLLSSPLGTLLTAGVPHLSGIDFAGVKRDKTTD